MCIAADGRIREAARVDELEHFGIGVEAFPKPLAYRFFAPLEHNVENDWHREERSEGRDSRRCEKVVVS